MLVSDVFKRASGCELIVEFSMWDGSELELEFLNLAVSLLPLAQEEAGDFNSKLVEEFFRFGLRSVFRKLQEN